MKFSSALIQVCRDVYIPYFKINALFFYCPLFFEEYLNPQVRVNKMVNKRTVDYHASPLGIQRSQSPLTKRIHPLIFLGTPDSFICLSRVFIQFSLKPVSWSWEILKSGVQVTGKCICESKYYIYSILLMPTKVNSPTGPYHNPPDRWKLVILPRQIFFKTEPFCSEEKGRS